MPARKHGSDMELEVRNKIDSYLQTVTIAVFGDCKVGKTSLIQRFLGSDLPKEYCPTIEEYYSKQFFHRNKSFSMSIIESSGLYEFPAMRRIAIEKADAFLLVYSANDGASLLKLRRYIEEIKDAGKSQNPVIVVSNKFDESPICSTEAELNPTEHQRLRGSMRHFVETEWELNWQECSPEDTNKITDIFRSLLKVETNEQNRKKNSRASRRLRSLLALTKKMISLKTIEKIQKSRISISESQIK